jgi:DNA-binding NarL/FixJ family response regulator
MQVKILIADDHDVVREGLKMILETQGNMLVVGTAADGRDVIGKAEALRPDVIIMDIAMPEMNGIEATRVLNGCLPAVKVIILSMHHTLEHIFRAMRAGAYGYLLKESAGAEIVKAVRTVMKGHHYFGKGIEIQLDINYAKNIEILKDPLDSLSQREREVLQLVVEGETSAKIARTLSLSPKSVETYRSRLMLKLGVDNIPSLVKFALLHGITSAN